MRKLWGKIRSWFAWRPPIIGNTEGVLLRLAMAAMGQPETKVADLCQELGITRQTLYRHISPKGELRPDGKKLLSRA